MALALEVVVVDLPEIGLAIELDGAEIMLTVGIVVAGERLKLLYQPDQLLDVTTR